VKSSRRYPWEYYSSTQTHPAGFAKPPKLVVSFIGPVRHIIEQSIFIFVQFNTTRFGHGPTGLRCPVIHVGEITVSATG